MSKLEETVLTSLNSLSANYDGASYLTHLRFPPLLSYQLTSIDHGMPSNMYAKTLFSLTLQYSGL